MGELLLAGSAAVVFVMVEELLRWLAEDGDEVAYWRVLLEVEALRAAMRLGLLALLRRFELLRGSPRVRVGRLLA